MEQLIFSERNKTEADMQRARLYTNELTNVSERLAAPMSNSFTYELREDGHLWYQDQSIGELLDAGVETARLIAQSQPHFMVEYVRRQIERQEYDEQRALALRSQGHDAMIVISPMPDAVGDGVDLGAYDSTRKKTLVRVYQRTEGGLKSLSLSLDRSDRQGLQAIAERFGGSIADNESSEEILAKRFYTSTHDHSDHLGAVVRSTYDEVLSKKFGGNWYAGRQDDIVLDTMTFAAQQTDLVKAHMAAISRIIDGHLTSREKLLEDARYNFAAALTRRMRNPQVEITLASAGAEARANGEEYKNDCPEGISPKAMLDKMGLEGNKMKCVNCPFCHKLVDAELSGGYIACPECLVSVHLSSGKVFDPKAKAVDAKSKSVEPKTTSSKAKKMATTQLRKEYGPDAVVTNEIGVGTSYKIIKNKQTGEILAKI